MGKYQVTVKDGKAILTKGGPAPAPAKPAAKVEKAPEKAPARTHESG
jgi:hypothetical protein